MKHSELNDQYWAVISVVCMFVTWGFIAIQAMMPDKVIDKSQQNLTYGKCGEWSWGYKCEDTYVQMSLNGVLGCYKEERFYYPPENISICIKPLLCEKKIIYESIIVPPHNEIVLNSGYYDSCHDNQVETWHSESFNLTNEEFEEFAYEHRFTVFNEVNASGRGSCYTNAYEWAGFREVHFYMPENGTIRKEVEICDEK